MALAPSSLSDLLQHGFDTVIDVRSPSEFAEDRMPEDLLEKIKKIEALISRATIQEKKKQPYLQKIEP